MKKKIKDKLDRKFLAKPYHHIDANILLGELIPDNERFRIACKNYIEEVGFHYRAGISILTLGEVHMKLYQYLTEKVARDKALEFLDKFIAKQRVKIVSISDNDVELFNKLREIETRADAPDLLSLAIAIREKAKVFITGDSALLNSETLHNFVKQLGTTIQKPIGL